MLSVNERGVAILSEKLSKKKKMGLIIVILLIFIGVLFFISSKLYPVVEFAPDSPTKEKQYVVSLNDLQL